MLDKRCLANVFLVIFVLTNFGLTNCWGKLILFGLWICDEIYKKYYHLKEINNELGDRVMLKAIQEISYPQDRNSTWLPDIQLPIFSQYRLQLEKGKLTGLKFCKRIGNAIVHRSNSSSLATIHIVFGLPQLQFSYNAGARYFMIFGNNWALTGKAFFEKIRKIKKC